MSKINKFNTDKFSLAFSNFPLPQTRTTRLDLEVFHSMLKSVNLPDFNIEFNISEFMGTKKLSPISKINNDLTPLTIDFHLDEDGENYYAFYEWQRELRCGNPTKGETTVADSTIKKATILMKDNQNRITSELSFSDCLLMNLSALNLIYGTNDLVTFSVTFQYLNFSLTRRDGVFNN